MNVGGAALRRLAYAGARYGPRPLVEYSPVFFGALFAALLPELRATVRENLRRFLGPRDWARERLDVLRTFVAYAHCLAESLGAERPEARGAATHVEGKEHLERAVASGRGAILVTAHTGAWDIAAQCFGREYGLRVALVMEAEQDEHARALHDRVRSQGGLGVVHVGKHPLDALPILRHLRGGGVAAIQLDRIAAGAAASLAVPLGREPFRVPEGPFRLGALSGAPVIPVFARRVGYFRYEIRVCPAIEVGRRPSEEELRRAALAATAAMEAFLAAHPTEWFHFRR